MAEKKDKMDEPAKKTNLSPKACRTASNFAASASGELLLPAP